PPYVPDGDIDGLEPEVARFEPRRALAGGADGLDAYRVLAPQVAALLRPGGAAVFEMGFGQAGAVRALLEGAGLEVLDIVSDLAGIDRVIRVRRGR
ncbi:MAG: protein-(glutamine-N5) methyltransferase, release factor-specific, partial [Alphaproteobacteria bacterium]|nr:protein-(glutamine-N5) methyltransferase, release factor-specific [Alphaproteobacteria bacterium]